MVRYGGPRFEFFFTHQFLNNEQAIRKEDAQRVAAIIRRRERAKAAEAAREEAKAAEAAREEEEKQQLQQSPEEVPSKSIVKPERLSQKGAQSKSQTLQQKRGLAGTAGCVMFPTARGVPMPEGHGGAPYTPGVDRHRIVPTQLQRSQQQQLQQRQQRQLSQQQRSQQQQQQQRSRAEEAECPHAAAQLSVDSTERRNAQRRDEETRGTSREMTGVEEYEYAAREDERSPSVFSHTSSNAPIRALGTQHMNTISTKKEVQEHLRNYGGSMVPPTRGGRSVTPFDDMSLPELTTRLVRMQQILRS